MDYSIFRRYIEAIANFITMDSSFYARMFTIKVFESVVYRNVSIAVDAVRAQK